MSLYFLLIFCVRREWIKVTLGIVLIVSFIFDFFVVIFIGKFEELEHKNVTENVAEIPNHMWYMPDSSKMGHPKRIDYYKYYTSQMIFSDESMALICKYEEPDYIDQKAALEENYIFQSEPLVIDEYSCEPTVELDGYAFRTLSVEEYLYKCDFPKTMIFIATNDATSEIVYLFFHSPDLDYVRDLDHCINDYCGWKRMR